MTVAPSEVADSGVQQRERLSGRRRPLLLAGAALLVAVLAAAGALIATGRLLGSGSPSGGVADNSTSVALKTVTRGPLSQQTSVSGTIAYTGTYTVLNQASGTITALPAVGQIIQQGQALYAVGGSPVDLLRGSTPAHRTLQEGMSGPDVAELNADLVALGLADASQLNATADFFSAATAQALERLQANLGLPETGSLELGQAVFLPSAARVTSVAATLGAPAQPGQTVLTASSTTKLVIVNLDAALQASVQVGDQAIITLPDNSTTPGTVSDVGTVATTSSSDSTPTVEVDITPSDPDAIGSLDQAPVQVAVTTAHVDDALIVPVNALLALAGGGYAVETVDGRGIHHLVEVGLGLFDDADGLVQVTGAGLSAGQQVVVPSS